MTGLTVDADLADDENLLGKVPSDLQENIVVGTRAIAGKLKYIADYTSAGYTGDEQSGNFLALHFEVPDVTGVTLTVELVNGIHGASTLDPDGLAIFRITDKNSQTIKVVASKDGYDSVTKIFALNGLTLVSGT